MTRSLSRHLYFSSIAEADTSCSEPPHARLHVVHRLSQTGTTVDVAESPVVLFFTCVTSP